MKNGFTLLELSIVLVIIGLIIGGITVGADLIKAAERNAVISDYSEFSSALVTFKLKYSALAGDMENASNYWPSCAGGDAGRCDGNGDDSLSFEYTVGTFPIYNSEGLRAWEHLGFAGLLEGSYTGEKSAGENTTYYPENSPTSPIGDGFYHFDSSQKYGSGAMIWNSLNLNNISPNDAKIIDSKIDDGIAYTGKMLIKNYFIAKTSPDACVDGDNTDATANFNFATEEPNCLLQYHFTY